MSDPLISVIVPVYNVEASLERCVCSIRNQTYKNLEILLVDDGSPDRCGGMCDAFAAEDSRIRVIHKENGGLSDARNAGMAAASGGLISFVDSDDTIHPEFLEQLHRAMTAYGADVAECGVRYVDEGGNVLRCRDAAQVPVMDKLEALRRLVTEDGIRQTVWNKLYRRHVALGVLFAVGKTNEDEFWTWQVFDRMGKLAVVQQNLYNYLQRSSSIIGVGFNARRLDGLQAQYQRMEYLQKYEELAVLTRQHFLLHCMWQYQCAARLMTGEERQRVQRTILDLAQRAGDVPGNRKAAVLKYRLWLAMFHAAPDLTVWIRNLLKIGV